MRSLSDKENPAFLVGAVSDSASLRVNPYTLIWYRAGWSKTKTKNNNTKYWEWEIMYNGFTCP